MNILNVTVFRPAGFPDCTGNGLSSKVNSGFLFMNCTAIDAIMWCKERGKDPSKQFILVKRELWGEDHAYAEPLIKPNNRAQVFGGNFLYTSDYRMYKTGGTYKVPVPIHDRFETWEEFEAMTV